MEANRLVNIKEYYFSKKLAEVAKMNQQGHDVVNLGIGNPDLSPPKAVTDELAKVVGTSNVHGYQSYKGVSLFREAISNWMSKIYGVSFNSETEVLPLIGSKEGINIIMQTFVNKDDEVLVPDLGYPTYRSVAKLVEAKVKTYNVELDVNQIERIITNKTKLIWLNYPHMPTGQQPDSKALKTLIDLAKKKNILIVNDNPYSTILTEKYFSIFHVEDAKSICLELNSLSKSHNMAGWRLGWVTGNSTLIQSILKVKSNMDSGMFLPLQLAAVKALEVEESWIKTLNGEYKQRREKAYQILDLLNCTYDQNRTGLFVWAKIPNDTANGENFIEEILQKAKVFLAPGFIFGVSGDRNIRVSLCVPIQKFDEAITRIKNHQK